MEAEVASILWRRSIELYNLRYKWMVSDGDSKAFNTGENVYAGLSVIKLDCIGHVQKRMRKHLMNLKAFRDHGRLTETKMKKLKKCYGLAIRQNILNKLTPTDTEGS